MKRLLPLAALLLAAGCNNAVSPVAPPMASNNSSGTIAEPSAAAKAGNIELNDENTKVTFVGTKPGGKHEGGFKKVEGTVKIIVLSPGMQLPADAAKIGSINVEIDTDSLSADDPTLTAHLKSPDFFDVKQFPKATFKSTKITGEPGKNEDATVVGDLTLHGVTKSITFPIHFNMDTWPIVLTSSFKINRKDFGMIFGEGKVDNEVTINVAVGKPAQ